MRPPYRTIAIVLLSVLIITLLTMCGRERKTVVHLPSADYAVRERTLRLPILGTPYTFNPNAIYEEYAEAIVENLFSRLVKLNVKGSILPDLSTHWSFNDDCTVLEMHLRQTVSWHDGEACTADDVIFTINAIRTQSGILAAHFANLLRVEKVSPYTIRLTFTRPSPLFLYTLAEREASILPKHLYDNRDWLTAAAVTSPVGTGPFRFVERVEGSRVVLERNASYFGGTPWINTVVFQAYNSAAEARAAFDRGDLEALTVGIPLSVIHSYEQDAATTVLRTDDATRILLAFNVANGVFRNNPTLRRAVAFALDREAMLTDALSGVGAVSYSFLSPLFLDALSATAVVPTYNATRSLEQLASRYSMDEEGHFLRLTLKVYDAEPYPEIAAVIKSCLSEVGIDTTVIQMDFDEWQEVVFTQCDFEMTLYGGYQGPYPEAIVHRLGIGGLLNFTGYQNNQLSDILYEVLEVPQPEKRNLLLREVQEVLASQLPIVPLVEWHTTNLVRAYVVNPPQASDDVSPHEYSKTSMNIGS